ncbi:MAG: fatty acid desaturase [Syntrophobacteraceae bacterium]
MVESKSDRTNSGGERKIPGRTWPDWHPVLANFRYSDNRKAIRQLINTLVPYCCLWYLMIRSIQLGYSYALTLVLALPAAAFLVRIFILFHDCAHGSFLKPSYANSILGYLLGTLVFTPFADWRFSHLRHHVTYANLDARGFGDIWTLTLKEYVDLPKSRRLSYKLYRNPVVLIGLGPIFIFMLSNRLPNRRMKRKERMSVIYTNLLILALFLAAAHFIGWRTYLLIQLPVLWLAGVAGIWLFYVQHQFEGGYWARKSEWDPLRAAMEGSSFYDLPAMLRWFSSNIGYHHVHHLSPRIPNYHLKKCFDTIPALQAKAPLPIMKSFSFIRLKVWDEEQQRMVALP